MTAPSVTVYTPEAHSALLQVYTRSPGWRMAHYEEANNLTGRPLSQLCHNVGDWLDSSGEFQGIPLEFLTNYPFGYGSASSLPLFAMDIWAYGDRNTGPRLRFYVRDYDSLHLTPGYTVQMTFKVPEAVTSDEREAGWAEIGPLMAMQPNLLPVGNWNMRKTAQLKNFWMETEQFTFSRFVDQPQYLDEHFGWILATQFIAYAPLFRLFHQWCQVHPAAP